MFRRKKKQETVEPPAPPEAVAEEIAREEPSLADDAASPALGETTAVETAPPTVEAALPTETAETSAAPKSDTIARVNRVQKIGTVSSDKMQKTVVVRVDRLVLHQKYRRYVRRASKFMAHDDLGATTGDRVRIVETRPLSARKRWRVVEIVQKAAK